MYTINVIVFVFGVWYLCIFWQFGDFVFNLFSIFVYNTPAVWFCKRFERDKEKSKDLRCH